MLSSYTSTGRSAGTAGADARRRLVPLCRVRRSWRPLGWPLSINDWLMTALSLSRCHRDEGARGTEGFGVEIALRLGEEHGIGDLITAALRQDEGLLQGQILKQAPRAGPARRIVPAAEVHRIEPIAHLPKSLLPQEM